ncbi:MAG: tRNA lysidine(34) synthetase TilS [Tenacibaculum sp.]|nr:tRNA lysidine(34) synthetase TilS [Tenacibaculum sp.]
MLKEFKKHIEQKLPFLSENKLLIAISGGIDSVVITHLLHKLNYKISLAHCNFKLRNNESDLDEEFVKNLGKELNIEVHTTSFNTKEYSKINKTSTQISARELRYDWFNELVKKHSFDYIITAHHADDNLETFIINLTRGTGLKGLTGIPEINKNIIRPLLNFSRENIKNYALKNNITWREDLSNSETKYIRNKIRHNITPKLKEINPELLNSFSKTLNYLKQSEQIIEDRINEISKNILTKENNILKFDIAKLKKLSNPKIYLYELLKNYGFTEWDNIYDLLSAQSGKLITSNEYQLLKNREFLILSKINDNSQNTEFSFPISEQEIEQPIKLKIETTNKTENTSKTSILVDKDLLNENLTIRKWQKGDIFYPIGLNGKKKLSKFFKDEKLSIIDKKNTWLLCNNNEIIWVIGMRQDRRFCINNKTKTILKISIN